MTLLAKRIQTKFFMAVCNELVKSRYKLLDEIKIPQFVSGVEGRTSRIVLCTQNVLDNLPESFKPQPNKNMTYKDPLKREHNLLAIESTAIEGTFFLLVSDLVTEVKFKETKLIIGLHQLGIINIKEIVNLSTCDFDILISQYLRRYSDAYKDVNLYSFRTHKIKNELTFQNDILALKTVGEGRGLNDTRIWVDSNTVLLPLRQTLSVVISNQSLLMRMFGESHKLVKEYRTLSWDKQSYDNGIDLAECRPFTHDEHITTHDVLFNNLQRNLLKMMCGIEVDKETKVSFNFYFPTRGDAVDKVREDCIRVNNFHLTWEKGSYHIAPIANATPKDLVLEMYEKDTEKGEYIILMDQQSNIDIDIGEILIDFYKHADWDVELQEVSVCGGGYNASVIKLKEPLMIFKDEDVKSGLIVLGDKL